MLVNVSNDLRHVESTRSSKIQFSLPEKAGLRKVKYGITDFKRQSQHQIESPATTLTGEDMAAILEL
jgi:hypothetical protein